MQQFENINNVKYYEVCCGGNSNLIKFILGSSCCTHTENTVIG